MSQKTQLTQSHKPQIEGIIKTCMSYLNQDDTELIVDNLEHPSDCKVIRSQIQATGRFPLNPSKLGLDEIKKASKRKALIETVQLHKAEIEQHLSETIYESLASYPDIVDESLLQKLSHTMNEVLNIFLEGIQQISPQVLSFIVKYVLEASLGTQSNSFIFNVGIGGNQIAPPYVESYILPVLLILRHLNQLKKEGKLSFIPIFCLSFSFPTGVIECDFDNQKQRIRPLLHYHTAFVTIERLNCFVNSFFPDVRHHVSFLRFPAYDRYSLPRISFAVLSQCIDPTLLEKLFCIKGDVVDPERQKQDLIYHLLGDYNAYVGRHLITTFMLSHQYNTLRFGSAYTESQFHASSSTLLLHLRKNSSEVKQKIQTTSLSLMEILLSQNQTCNDWNDSNLALSNFDFMKEQLANQCNLPPSSKLYGQIGIASHASYVKHPGESSLKELVKNRFFSAEALVQANRSDKAQKLKNSFSTTKIVGFDNYIDFLAQWVNQYKDYSIDDGALVQSFCNKHEVVQSILCDEAKTRELMNYHLF